MMSFHQRRIAKTRSISSLTTLNSCETNLRVPSLSVKSTSSVKRLSRRECRKLLKKKSTIRPIHQQSEKRTRSMDWYKQSPFEVQIECTILTISILNFSGYFIVELLIKNNNQFS